MPVELLSSATHLFILDLKTREISIRHNATNVTIKIKIVDYIRSQISLITLLAREIEKADDPSRESGDGPQ